MRKRLRKKRHLGEFQELGFTVWWSTKTELNDEALNQFFDRFIEEAIEANGLSFGGGIGSNEGEGFVVSSPGRSSATDEHRAIFQEWSRRIRMSPNVASSRFVMHGMGGMSETHDPRCDEELSVV